MSLFTRIKDLIAKSASNTGYFLPVDKAGITVTEKMPVTDLIQDLSLSGETLNITDGASADLTDIAMIKKEKYGGLLETNPVTMPLRMNLSTDVKLYIDGYIAELPTGFRKNFTTIFSAGSNNGGLDTGTYTPNRVYDAYVITNATGLNEDLLFVLEDATPVMPAGWKLSVLFAKYKTSYKTIAGATIDYIIQSYELFEGLIKNPFIKNHINGFDITALTTTSVQFGFGECRDFADTQNIVQKSTISKSTSTFVEGANNGMFEASIIADTLYSLYVILGDNGRIDYFASTSTTPTLPTNFNQYQLIGYLETQKTITEIVVFNRDETCNLSKIVTFDDNLDLICGFKQTLVFIGTDAGKIINLPDPSTMPNDDYIRQLYIKNGGTEDLKIWIDGGAIDFARGNNYIILSPFNKILIGVAMGWWDFITQINVFSEMGISTPFPSSGFASQSPIPFDVSVFEDNDSVLKNDTANERINIKITGNYLVSYYGNITVSSGSNFEVEFIIKKNGTTDITTPVITGSGDRETTNVIQPPTKVHLEAGDYIEVYADYSGTLNGTLENFNFSANINL